MRFGGGRCGRPGTVLREEDGRRHAFRRRGEAGVLFREHFRVAFVLRGGRHGFLQWTLAACSVDRCLPGVGAMANIARSKGGRLHGASLLALGAGSPVRGMGCALRRKRNDEATVRGQVSPAQALAHAQQPRARGGASGFGLGGSAPSARQSPVGGILQAAPGLLPGCRLLPAQQQRQRQEAMAAGRMPGRAPGLPSGQCLRATQNVAPSGP